MLIKTISQQIVDPASQSITYFTALDLKYAYKSIKSRPRHNRSL